MQIPKSRISIGMPVYNAEKYIDQALESILKQTYSNFEVIISDNASTDNTERICREYITKDTRISYYRNPRNLGAAPNFNKVFSLSSGKYFKWAAYDDVLAPEFLSRCIEVLDNEPEVVLCYPRSNIIDENGNFLGEHTFKAKMSSPERRKRFRDMVLHPDTAFQVFGVMRTDIAKKTGLIGSYPASDLVFLAELALYGKFFELSEPLFFPRYHAEQSTRGELKIERDRISWFDTSLKNKNILPKWKYLFGYLKAINKSPLGSFERIYCYAQLMRWVFMPDHFRALGKDLLIAFSRL